MLAELLLTSDGKPYQLQATKCPFEVQNIHLNFSVQIYPSQIQRATLTKPMVQPLLLTVTKT
jgi:hypothetical protein